MLKARYCPAAAQEFTWRFPCCTHYPPPVVCCGVSICIDFSSNVLPNLLLDQAMTFLGSIAYLWHGFVDPADPSNQYINSMTIIDGLDNVSPCPLFTTALLPVLVASDMV